MIYDVLTYDETGAARATRKGLSLAQAEILIDAASILPGWHALAVPDMDAMQRDIDAAAAEDTLETARMVARYSKEEVTV